MVRRLGLCLGLALLFVPAAQVRSARADLPTLQGKIADARSREAALAAEIADVTTRIRVLERREVDVSRKLSVLQHDLDLHRQRLRNLAELYRIQTDRLEFLRSQYRLAVNRLSLRLIDVYENGDLSKVEVALSSSSFRDLLDSLEYADIIGEQDSVITQDVKHGRIKVQAARVRTRTARVGVASETRVIAVRTAQVRDVHNGLLVATHSLTRSRSSKRASLAAVKQSEREYINEANGLLAASRTVASRIQAAAPSAPSVDAVVRGPDLARFWPGHEPVRLALGPDARGDRPRRPYGSPIHAAASGTVIYCGWEGGYGNLTVIDHGGGIATAYGHQSIIIVTSASRSARAR